jgi:hypothetical protein
MSNFSIEKVKSGIWGHSLASSIRVLKRPSSSSHWSPLPPALSPNNTKLRLLARNLQITPLGVHLERVHRLLANIKLHTVKVPPVDVRLHRERKVDGESVRLSNGFVTRRGTESEG